MLRQSVFDAKITGRRGRKFTFCFSVAVCLLVRLTPPLAAEPQSIAEQHDAILTDEQWDEISQSIDLALHWLAGQQQADGSFPTRQNGQPGVTALCVLAFLAQGHLPGEGQYGDELKNALRYIASCQKRNGILASAGPDIDHISRDFSHRIGNTAFYNHGIAGLVLSETYSMAGAETTKEIQSVIEHALDFSFQTQDWPKLRKIDDGGWRYLNRFRGGDSDLSVTGWQLMFFRSAKNAGFDVEHQRIKRAVDYVRRCFLKKHGTFTYKDPDSDRVSRAMAGAGILALAHAGLHHTPESQQTGDWILKSGFHQYNVTGRIRGSVPKHDRYHYGLLTCCQAMYQLGGRHWREFFPQTAAVLIASQNTNGSWHPEKHSNDGKYGNSYTTAIAVIALSAPNQLLPIFQR